MANSTAPTKADLQEIIDQAVDLVEEALDPELTREDVVSKLKEISDVLSDEDVEEEEEEEEADDDYASD